MKHIVNSGIQPEIRGAGGGGGKSGSVTPNSLFSTDVLFLTVGLSEGPVYRINPNGPQDIQISDNSIDDLLNLDTDGSVDPNKFNVAVAYGTTTQDPLYLFGTSVVTPQAFGSPVKLKKGNISGVPASKVLMQETSQVAWDSLKFNFVIESLGNGDKKGNVRTRAVALRITVYDYLGTSTISSIDVNISGKTDTPYKKSIQYNVPSDRKSDMGYRFTVEKISDDTDDAYTQEDISFFGWDEVKNTPQAYPRTAVIGYAIKAANEHTGGIPNFTSLVKGLLVKVPSNYNQPILANGEIDWRELEVAVNTRTNNGYMLQNTGPGNVIYEANPYIYKGAWDGTFVYSWTQNPVWIIYDILTNTVHGLGIPEDHIDKYKFYQVAQYCDACSNDGRFQGVSALADGSFRYKPRGTYVGVKENQIGLPKGTRVSERRFILDLLIEEQGKSIDLLNKLTSSFRSLLVYSGGKITLATDMPEEYPVMLFNDTNIKEGSFVISGVKESEIFTGVDISYIEPTNHFKRESVRIDNSDSADGSSLQPIEYIANLDMPGVTRRSQAMRAAHYHLASSKYQRRSVSFETGTEAMSLTPGDVISVASKSSGVSYGHSGKVSDNSILGSNTSIHLEHFTMPAISSSFFRGNTNPIALRILKPNTERMDLYILSNTNYTLSSTGNTNSSIDSIRVTPISRFDPISKSIVPVTTFFSNNLPQRGDLWSLGEFANPGNYFSNQTDRLFKVTNIERDTKEQTVVVSGLEYISNVYVDSDTFINYEPTSYVDVLSPFAAPPAPDFNMSAVPRSLPDGSVVVDGVITNYTDKLNYDQKFDTEYYVSYPEHELLITNVIQQNPLIVEVEDTSMLVEGSLNGAITGKNGFSTDPGTIKLLCTNSSIYNLDKIRLTVPGLSLCTDDNFNKHVLEVNDGSILKLKGIDRVRVPIEEKTSSVGLVNFVGYYDSLTAVSLPIHSYDLASNSIFVENTTTDLANLYDKIPNTPFYVSIDQILAKNYYANNSMYVAGSEKTHVTKGTLIPSYGNNIKLPVVPRYAQSVRVFIDGIQLSGGYSVNIGNPSYVYYTSNPRETDYRIEVDVYGPPPIEMGDRVQLSYNNVFTVINTSYAYSSSHFNQALTDNYIYKIQLDKAPELDVSGVKLINVSKNPVGTINNITSNTVTLSYSFDDFPSLLSLGKHKLYSLLTSSTATRVYFEDETVIEDLPIGTTIVKARNKNLIGRMSPFAEQSIRIEHLPIQKVQNISVVESLYKEQTGGVAVRATVSFDHILQQEVTDYELSYKLDSIENLGTDDGGSGLTSFNTVKLSAAGVNSDNRISYTINNINRGAIAASTTLSIKITPMNKTIRGFVAEKSVIINGKTNPPKNVYNFTGGQQDNQITLFWSYHRTNDELEDLDLKEVIIRRLPGIQGFDQENFLLGTPFVTVSAGSVRKSIPIDQFGTYTYLVKTRDTSGNFSTDVQGVVITTSKPKKTLSIVAYNEDSPQYEFTDIPNTNSNEYNFASFSNSFTGGIAYSNSTIVDSSNGSATGWSTTIDNTNIEAEAEATYITQIRDLGQVVTGIINIEAYAVQTIQTKFTSLKEVVLEGVTEASTGAMRLKDIDNGGIGHILGYSNTSVVAPRYDSNNKTWMTGSAAGNVWAIWNPGQYIGDIANANSYALIAGLRNNNEIVLGETFFANGVSTKSNTLANLTMANTSYQLVNLTQFLDTGPTATFMGEIGVVQPQLYVRTSSADTIYYSNGNVITSAFEGYQVNDGYLPYEAGTKIFRYFQIKYVVHNSDPEKYNLELDRFRYTIDKEKQIFSKSFTYDSAPKTVDISEANFIYRPAISYDVTSQIGLLANPVIAVTTSASNSEISFMLLAADGTGPYNGNSTANVTVTAIGV